VAAKISMDVDKLLVQAQTNNGVRMLGKTVLALSVFISVGCHAASSSPVMCADSDMNNQQIYECSRQKIIDADAELNRSYQALSDRISKAYTADTQLGNELKAHVTKSQRAWITVRDENCLIESFVISRGTPAHEATKNLCLARESLDRSRYLKDVAF